MGDQAPARQAHLGLPGERESVRLPADLEHLQKLADAMAPEPREWSYTGEVVDAQGEGAKCVCGHPIRWIFVIRRERDGALLPIGSTCIETSIPYLVTHGAEGLAELLREAVRELRRETQRQATAAKREVRETEQGEVVERLTRDWAELIDWQRRARDVWYREHGPGYPYALALTLKLPEPCKRPGATVKRLVREYKRRLAYIAVDPQADQLLSLPTPRTTELQADEEGTWHESD